MIEITGKTITLDVDTFFSTNYCNLIQYCCDKNIELDELNEVYIKLKTISLPTGMTASEYHSYIKKSLWNRMLDNKKSLRYKNTVYSESICRLTDNQDWIEQALKAVDDDNEDSRLYTEQIEYLTKKLFQYIEKNGFTEYEVFIFKSYFLVPKMTYKKLNEEIGIDMTKIQRTIRMFKHSIKTNFIKWLADND